MTRTGRRAGVLMAAGALAFAVLAASCGSPNPEPILPRPSGSPHIGGTYRFPLQGDPQGIEPLTAQGPGGLQVAHQVFQGLVAYQLDDDGALQTVPELATKWTMDPTATIFTFTLRHGVHFQPPVGREVTAEDFVRSWNRVTNPLSSCPTAYILAPIVGCRASGYRLDPGKGLAGVQAIGRYTLRVRLRYPFADFPKSLGTVVTAVTPVDYIRSVGQRAYERKPVGTGPYMVQSWTAHQGIDLVRNPVYWDPGKAGYVDRIQFPILSGAEAMWRRFQAGGLDMTEVPENQILSARNDARVASGRWSAVLWPRLSVTMIGIDMKDPILGAPGGATGALLRQALALATDQDAVCNVVDDGVPAPASGLVPPGCPGYRADQSPYVFNLDQARKLVAQMVTKGSFVTPLDYWYVDGSTERQTSVALGVTWQSAGITVMSTGFKPSVYAIRLSKGPLAGSQLFRMTWSADYPSIDAFLSPFLSPETPSGSYTFYSDPGVDELIRKARSTTDGTQRNNLYAMAEKGILAAAPVIPLAFERDFRVLDDRVHDQVLDPLGFVDMWKVWIRPAAAQ